ncbi:hypothetical protein [Cohnella sp.]|uniref:hypothetical protein n=1 Tax=Cohnella sp. TaxID=1883426 RepID=UPI003704652D
MAETPNAGLPLIEPNMTANVPRDYNALAEAVDAQLGDMSAVPTTAKTAAGAIAELYAAVEGDSGDNQTVSEQIALILETDTRKTIFEYTAGVLSAIVEKDGAIEVARTTLNYSGGTLNSIVEVAGGKTVTSTFVRDGGGILTEITKGVS